MCTIGGLPGGSDGKESAAATLETQVPSLGWEDPLEKEMATHSGILAWRLPWTEEPRGYSPCGQKESEVAERLTLIYTYRRYIVLSPSLGP